MKKFLMIAMLLSSFNLFAECSERYEKRVDTTARATAFVLNCENKLAVRASIDRSAKRIGFCRDDKGIVCNLAGKGAAYLIRRQIPTAWECKPDIAMTAVSFAVSKACEAITGL